jgi:integrase
VRKRDKRRPFSTDQLQRIFSAPIFTGCEDDEQGYARPGPNRPRRARFWIPLIALTSGMRLNEICQLDTSDVRTLDDVPCLHVREGVGAEEDQKRVKTAASERLVPVHKLLRAAGFLIYVEDRRVAGDSKLFPELRVGSTGYRSKIFSQWFARFLAGRGASAPLTCFHSYRHNFRDALRASGISRELSLALGGWTQPGATSEIADIYGNGFPPQMLAEALDKVDFPGLDLTHLVDVDLQYN